MVNNQEIRVVNTGASEGEAAALVSKIVNEKTKKNLDLDQSIEVNVSQNAPKTNISIEASSQQASKVKAEIESVAHDVKTKKTPEILKLESELKGVQKDVMQIDGENRMLQTRFQKILNKNRDLTLELKRINDKIQVAD